MRLVASLLLLSTFLSGCLGFGVGGGQGNLTYVTGSVRIDSGWSTGPQVVEAGGAVGPLGLAASDGGGGGAPAGRISISQLNMDLSEDRGDVFIVRVRRGTQRAAVEGLARRHGFEYIRPTGEAYHLLRRRNTSIAEAQDLVRGAREILSIELDRPVVPMELPNDPYFVEGKQWALAQIRATLAWEALKEAGVPLQGRNIVVAVVDTGIDFLHEDLNDPAMWVDGVDLTVQDEEGVPYTFADGNAKAEVHGTLVAGVIGALANNARGIAGAAWGTVRLMPIRVFDSSNPSYKPGHTKIAEAVKKALELGANVINLSLGDECTAPICPQPAQPLKDALEEAWNAGVPVIAAAGNYQGGVVAPANHDKVIAVSATTYAKQLAGYSSHGTELNVAAPGGAWEDIDCYLTVVRSRNAILGPRFGGGYRCMAGTSFAAPHVTGIVALMLARGAVTDPLDVMRTLEITAQRSSYAFDNDLGWGLVDAYGAVTGGVPIVFLGTKGSDSLTAVTAPVRADGKGGAYTISGVPAGTWQVFAWYDVNQNGLVDTGDYFGESQPFDIETGKNRKENLTLTRYAGTALAVDF